MSPLYFFRSSISCGLSADILRIECICLTNSGTRMSRIKTTSTTIVRNHASPLVEGMIRLSAVWMCAITQATATYRGLSGFTS